MLILTYGPDQTHPNCTRCGRPVLQPDHIDPTQPWSGTCVDGHTDMYQLEEDDSDESTD